MTSAPASHEVICPHCKKQFRAELLGGRDERHRGFKCPHCRLFVPYERADEQDLVQPAEAS
jgi:transposase-like protein